MTPGAGAPGNGRSAGVQVEDFFAGHPDARAVFEKVRSILEGLGPVDVRTSKSQVAFRRKRGFAYIWLPGRYLARPTADVVLSIVLGRRDGSTRFTEVVHPAPAHWIHHLEVREAGEIDDEVVDWLREAADRAGSVSP